MLIQKSNPDDRKMTNDCYIYSDVDGSTAPTTTTTTTDTAAYHHTNTDNLSIEKKKELLQNKDISYYANHVFGVLLLSTWLAWIRYVRLH